MEFLDGTLKLRHCTNLFTMRFPPWSVPRVGNGSGKRQSIFPGHLLGESGPGVYSHIIPPEWGVRWASLAIFFLDLGLGEVCAGDAWNLPSEETVVGGLACWPTLI